MIESEYYLQSAIRMAEEGVPNDRILEILQLRAKTDAEIAANSPYGAGPEVSPLRAATNYLIQLDVK